MSLFVIILPSLSSHLSSSPFTLTFRPQLSSSPFVLTYLSPSAFVLTYLSPSAFVLTYLSSSAFVLTFRPYLSCYVFLYINLVMFSSCDVLISWFTAFSGGPKKVYKGQGECSGFVLLLVQIKHIAPTTRTVT
jgi:hypothetical protein